MLNSDLSPQVVFSEGGFSSAGTGFEASNATSDPYDEFDQDNLDFLELAGLYNGSSSNNAQTEDPQIGTPDANRVSVNNASPYNADGSLKDGYYYEYSSSGISPYRIMKGDMPSDNPNASNVSPNDGYDDSLSDIKSNYYDFSELLELYNQSLAKQYEFNAQEAQKDREWQKMMSDTAYQRAFEDMKKAGLNPLVALGQLGPASTPGGASATGSYGSISPLSSSLVNFLNSNKQLSGNLISSVVKVLAVIASLIA